MIINITETGNVILSVILMQYYIDVTIYTQWALCQIELTISLTLIFQKDVRFLVFGMSVLV